MLTFNIFSPKANVEVLGNTAVSSCYPEAIVSQSLAKPYFRDSSEPKSFKFSSINMLQNLVVPLPERSYFPVVKRHMYAFY